MQQLTKAQLLRAVPELCKTHLDEFIAAMNQWCIHYGITSNKRLIHFLAQCFTESGALKYVEENLNYSADGLIKTFPKYFNNDNVTEYARQPQKIANRVYANRMGNGNEASGDGWKYRGRGIIQLTGKGNVSDYSKSDLCTVDAVSNPDLLCKFPDHTKAALWFWEKNGLNELADRDDGGKCGEDIVKQITKKVNGGQNGIAQRLFYYRRFKREFVI